MKMKNNFFVIPKSIKVDGKSYRIKLTEQKIFLNGKSGSLSGLFDPERRIITIRTTAKDRSPAEILFHELHHLFSHQNIKKLKQEVKNGKRKSRRKN